MNETSGDGPVSSHDGADWFEQRGFGLRFGWGPNGLRRLAPDAAWVIIIDVLSFSTSVDVAVGRGAVVLPYRWHDGSEQDYARGNDAVVAERSPQPGRLSLRPSSLVEIESGLRLVLPSPNGSALTFGAEDVGAQRVVVGCLRNAAAVAEAVTATDGDDVAVIAAGERWRGSTGPLRPAIEDLLGAGAILAALAKSSTLVPSPEARTSIAAFVDARPDLAGRLRDCGSGRELIGRGFGPDVELAADLDVSRCVPTLQGAELIDRPES